MQRYRLNLFDAGNDILDEWYGAAYISDKYNLFKDQLVPLYIRGTRHDFIFNIFLYFQEDVSVQVTGIPWGPWLAEGDSLFTRSMGNPIKELLIGTFRSSAGGADRISTHHFDWLYTLQGMRQVKLGLNSQFKMTHRRAMRVCNVP